MSRSVALVPFPALPVGTNPGQALGKGGRGKGRDATGGPEMSFPWEGGPPWFLLRKKALTPPLTPS